MKEINVIQLEQIVGGSEATDFGDGFCAGVALWGAFVAPVGLVLGGGCAIYAVYRLV
ncbi:hypothetical protein GCM10027429_01840 [Marivirga atlantica]|jgi:hypothetical protein|uniref:Uncharacterized protein n=1 Tax=Marivirga atlantica TaxID=1548457 RepID=A0A937A7I8_9BACT|nr:hypothetical protein [Marivirga atlantica]MBL0763796.1 hypothetical protein [Marivirga atlantica]